MVAAETSDSVALCVLRELLLGHSLDLQGTLNVVMDDFKSYF